MDWGSCVFGGQNGIPTIDCIKPLYTIAVTTALGLVGTVSIFLLIYAGIKYITSGGGKQVEEAKHIVTYALLGLVIVLLAIFIINLISKITGVGCIQWLSTNGCVNN